MSSHWCDGLLLALLLLFLALLPALGCRGRAAAPSPPAVSAAVTGSAAPSAALLPRPEPTDPPAEQPAPAAPAAAAPRSEETPPAAPAQPLPLFQRYPRLGRELAHVSLTSWPTPVERLAALEQQLGLRGLFVKRDDLAGQPYGGSKIRKLELILAEARRQGARTVITTGGVGSNQGLATALCARKLGFRAVLLLLPEPPTDHVRHHLLAAQSSGAELHLLADVQRRAAVLRRLQRRHAQSYLIAAGGSSLRGNVGYVNAGFELEQQIAQGLLPPPDVIYLAAGTMGSAVGLSLGLRAAGLEATQVWAVRVSSPSAANDRALRAMFEETRDFLRALDPSFPAVAWQPGSLSLHHGHAGGGYAVPSAEGAAAITTVRRHGGPKLDPVYTGKAFAALLAHARERLQGKQVLFWHTYDARRLDVSGVDPRSLPPAFAGYFRY